MAQFTRSLRWAVAGIAACVHCGGRVSIDDPIPGPGPSTGPGVGPTGTTGGAPVGTGAGGSGSTGGPIEPVDVWLAFDSSRSDFNRDIYVVRPDGSDLRRLTMASSIEQEPAFSLDGTKIAFVSDRSGSWQIHLMGLENGVVSQITDRAGGAHRPAFSPDGARIAYRSGLSIYSARLDGTDEREVATAPWASDFGGPSYTTDGQWIIFDDYNDIRAVHPDGSGVRVIVPATTAEQSFPTVSPDGRNVALQVTCGEGFKATSIWVVPLSGVTQWACASGRRISADLYAAHPAWGPNDTVAWDGGNGEGNIVLRKNDQIVNVTSGPDDDRNPAWSPAGTRVPAR